MPQWDAGLLGVHRDIAADQSASLHVLAGPGTGKTFAMMRRIARLLEDGVAADKILAVSFTRTAARDLREQLANLGVDGADEVRATTLHSLCFGVLSSQEAFSFTHRTPRPLLSYEIACLEDDLSGAFGGKKPLRRLLEAYEAAWARLQREQPGHAPTAADQAFETSLLSWLRFHSAMLIGELIPLTLAFLRANPQLPVLPVLLHVLVDEFQDLNKADQALVRELATAAALLVIGDDNQSTYSFRHANPEGMRSFPTDVPGTVHYSITESRRCPPNIVELSNALISHDPHTTRPHPLTPDPARTPADVLVVQHSTLENEISSTADFIHHYLAEHPDLPAGRVLVLTPRRFIGNAIRDALIAKGRNALSYFQEDALSEEAAAEGFCLLSLLVVPDDRASIRAWLGFGSADNRCRPYARLRSYCESTGASVTEVLASLAAGTIARPYAGPLIERWNVLQVKLGTVSALSGLALVDALWPPGNDTLTDIRSLAGSIALGEPSNEELLEVLREVITQPELPGSDSDIIQIMSLHKSKGLTRDVVVIAGCMAGTIPRIDPQDPPEVQNNNQLEEQRRLFYVGITRATQMLVISAAASLPLKDALRSGASVVRRTFGGGQPLAITAFTPFVGELASCIRTLRGLCVLKRAPTSRILEGNPPKQATPARPLRPRLLKPCLDGVSRLPSCSRSWLARRADVATGRRRLAQARRPLSGARRFRSIRSSIGLAGPLPIPSARLLKPGTNSSRSIRQPGRYSGNVGFASSQIRRRRSLSSTQGESISPSWIPRTRSMQQQARRSGRFILTLRVWSCRRSK